MKNINKIENTEVDEEKRKSLTKTAKEVKATIPLEKGVEKKITHPIPNYLSVKVKSKTGSIEENQWLR